MPISTADCFGDYQGDTACNGCALVIPCIDFTLQHDDEYWDEQSSWFDDMAEADWRWSHGLEACPAGAGGDVPAEE